MDKDTLNNILTEFENVTSEVREELKKSFHSIRIGIEKELKTNPVFVYSVASAILVVLLTSILFCCLRRRKTLRNSILIVGLSESGKTLLFSKLAYGRQVTTYTSMKENTAVVSVPNTQKKVWFVDIPGNERVRSKYLEQYLPSAKGIMFVLDSLTFQKDVRDIANYLYSVLQERFIRKNGVPFLIVCNKQDCDLSKSAKVIQSQLEKEINALRHTQTAQLSSTSPEEERVFLGQKGKDFQFPDLKPVKVTFVESCALHTSFPQGHNTSMLPEIWPWISKVA